jgi:hippurate hydrolase
MLLGAAKHLARARTFQGTVHFIFQPAEENECGGKAMVEAGLFDRFPCDSVYGMHNWPGLEAGRFAINHGAMMASYDLFEVLVHGQGTHAAMPERGVDSISAAAHVVLALQAIPSRRISALDSAVVTVTQVHGGETWNVVPESVLIRGGARCFSTTLQDEIEAAIREISTNAAAAYGARATVAYRRLYPPTINSGPEVDVAIAAAKAVVGGENVQFDCQPSMAAEDFAFLLQARPGAYIWLGSDGEKSEPLHSPRYDFNDDVLALGATYWVSLVELALAIQGVG